MIYLDHNATTPVDAHVLETMLPYFSQKFGNAASTAHAFGWMAADAVALARERVAALLNAEPAEITFTSGATESINLALKGVWEVYQGKGRHIVTVATEHKAVLDVCQSLERQGATITYLPVDHQGLIDLVQLEDAITSETILVCVMMANNETGVLQPIAEIGKLCKGHGVLFMSDITQAVGKLPVNLQALGIDIAPLSAHKIYGPKGVGAIYLRRRGPRVKLPALIEGGGHENGLRSGTLNVPGIVGLGKAAEIALQQQPCYYNHTMRLRQLLEGELLALHNTHLNGHTQQRLPNTVNISFGGLKAGSLLKALADTVAVSSGSACTSALMEPSYVLKAMGVSDEMAYNSIRFSLGKDTTETEVRESIARVKSVLG
ncbi:IscS subfamily cysteine desulfurase [soil metagenome]